MRDLVNNISAASTLAPAVYNASTDGAAVDTRGFESLAAVIHTGAIVSAGDFSVKFQESDASGSGFTDIAADGLVANGLPATLVAASVYECGFRQTKRYVRAVLTKAGGTSIAVGITLLRGNPNLAPV